jgi:hypothetical protein
MNDTARRAVLIAITGIESNIKTLGSLLNGKSLNPVATKYFEDQLQENITAVAELRALP